MHHHRKAIVSGAVALFALASASAASATVSRSSSTVNAPAVAAPKPVIRLQSSRTATLHAATSIVDGKSETILVDAQGLPLYYYKADTAKTSMVSGELLRLWPALIAARPTATGTQGRLTTLREASGRQVAYNGHFLYTFISDTPRHVTGQGVSDFFVATPHLKAIGKTSKSKTSVATSSGGYAY
jgi:predicted lipoprotein with Yx(FWY)xxD motif